MDKEKLKATIKESLKKCDEMQSRNNRLLGSFVDSLERADPIRFARLTTSPEITCAAVTSQSVEDRRMALILMVMYWDKLVAFSQTDVLLALLAGGDEESTQYATQSLRKAYSGTINHKIAKEIMSVFDRPGCSERLRVATYCALCEVCKVDYELWQFANVLQTIDQIDEDNVFNIRKVICQL